MTGRENVADSASMSSEISARYATAVFELAKETDSLSAVERDLDALDAALDASPDFRLLITSPVYTRSEQEAAVAALAGRMELSETVSRTLALMAQKRRLFVLRQLVAAVRGMIAAERGEVTADVTTPVHLAQGQLDRLAGELATALGKDVKIRQAVDKDLIGGLVIRVGSRMIDSSIRSKLLNLQNAMKEVG